MCVIQTLNDVNGIPVHGMMCGYFLHDRPTNYKKVLRPSLRLVLDSYSYSQSQSQYECFGMKFGLEEKLNNNITRSTLLRYRYRTGTVVRSVSHFTSSTQQFNQFTSSLKETDKNHLPVQAVGCSPINTLMVSYLIVLSPPILESLSTSKLTDFSVFQKNTY